MAVFNSLLIKHICILPVLLPTFASQMNFPTEAFLPPFLHFHVTLTANLRMNHAAALFVVVVHEFRRRVSISSYVSVILYSTRVGATGSYHEGCGLSV